MTHHLLDSRDAAVEDAVEIGVMTRAELDQVLAWAAEEGWMPGAGDAEAYAPTDPGGRFAARVDGRMIASVGAVNWGPDYGFGGLFITAPQWRSRGIGGSLVAAGMAHVGDRLLALDGVPEQVPYYERLGMRTAHWHVRYGTAAGVVAPEGPSESAGFRVVAGRPELIERAVSYDAQFFPGDRVDFMGRWLDPQSAWRTWYAALDDSGQVIGLGVIRPAAPGFRVGPLEADTPEVAAALFDTLAAGRPGPVCIDIPDVNSSATALVLERGMTPAFRCARMYNGPAPALPLQRYYGVCTLELG